MNVTDLSDGYRFLPGRYGTHDAHNVRFTGTSPVRQFGASRSNRRVCRVRAGGRASNNAVAQEELTLQGIKRSYVVHRPSGEGAGPLPLVIALHGLRGNGGRLRRWFGLGPVANREKFVAVYLSSVGIRWS